MKYVITCKTCNKPAGEFDLDDPELVTLIVARTHAFGDHSGNHQIEVQPLESGPVRVELTCKLPNCQYFEKKEVYEVASYAVGATVIMFHARNEGHKFELIIDGKEVTPITNTL